MLKNKTGSVIAAGIVGSILEWYDFSIYAFFAPLFSTLFFPKSTPFLQMLSTLGVFAIGFMARPLGALILGYLGDSLGRRKTLIISICLISLPTFMMAFMPTYEMIGLASPILLLLLRVLQGIAIGGELTTATSFLIEHAPPNRRSFFGSFSMISSTIGIMLSSIIAILLNHISNPEYMMQWGWRLAFLIGGVLGIIGLIIRLRASESEEFIKASHEIAETKPLSLWEELKHLNFKKILFGVFLASAPAVGGYFLIAYFHLSLHLKGIYSHKMLLFINLGGLFCLAIMIPIMGLLSDYIGRKKVLKYGLISLYWIILPIFWLLHQPNPWLILLAECLFALTLASLTANISSALAELFKTRERNLSLSLSYNIGYAVFGGTTPLVGMSLTHWSGSYFMPALYFMSCIIASLYALRKI